jgi:hypothetical protein
MKRSTAAVYNVSKISGYLGKLFNSTQKVNIGLMGDSTVLREGHGWDTGVVNALASLGLRRFGTGLQGAAGQDGSAGFGSSEDDVSFNAVPINTQTNNGFTGSLPANWYGLAGSNWGDAINATADSKRTNLGVLLPLVVTASSVSSSTNAFTVHGNEALGHTRPFPGLTNDLIFNHWYAIEQTAINGRATSVAVRKTSDAYGYQNIYINNVNGAAGGNFTFTMGLTTTGNIAYNTDNTILAAQIVAALTASFANLTGGSLTTSVVAGTGLVSGDVAINIKFGKSGNGNGIDMPPITVNAGTLTAQYNGTGYSAGQIFTEVYGLSANKGFFTTFATYGALTAGNQLIDAENPRYVTRAQFVLGASASRDYTVGFIPYSGGVSGPWCSLFNSVTLSGATSGYSCTPLIALGGKGARTHAITIQNQTNTFLKEVFLALAEHAGATSPSNSPLLIRVCGGANDKALEAGTTSVGPIGGLTSNTAAGLQDNWQAIINRVHGIYDANSWSKNNLYWLFVASMESNVAGTDLSFARSAAQNIADANDRTAAVNVYNLTEGFTADISGLQGRNADTTIDYFHPSYYGYKVYSQVEWGSLLDAYTAYASTSSGAIPAATNGVWFAGKVYTRDELDRILQAYYRR